MKDADESREAAMGLIAFLIYCAITPFALSLRGWVLSQLWFWFVVAKFHVPALGIAEAIGLALTLGMLTSRAKSCKQDDRPFWEQVGDAVGSSIVVPLLAILFGYVVHSFVS